MTGNILPYNLAAGIKPPEETGNNLFPAFLKLENLRLLIVGGGYVGLEKLNAVLQNSPATRIKIVAITVSEQVKELSIAHDNIDWEERPYRVEDTGDADIIIVAVNNRSVSKQVWIDAKEKGKLINVADTPDLCDFYLGSIVKKGNLKIAISTNGKSPTIAKRLKEEINTMIPDEMESVLDNMQTIRQGINGGFSEKVKQLNDLTKVLVAKQTTLEEVNEPGAKKWQQIVKWCLFAFFFMILGHGILGLIPFGKIIEGFGTIPRYIDVRSFLIMTLTGFMAQMVDGSLGMGYGTISTTFLLANGVSPAIVSSRVHSARVFSSRGFGV